jgi:hypothetical protein
MINFPAKFVLQPHQKNERKLDPCFIEKMRQYSDTLFALLVYYYQKYYKTEGVQRKPQCIENAIREYRYSQNVALRFKDEACVREEGSIVRSKEVLASFESFCRFHGITKTQNTVSDLYDELDNAFGKVNAQRTITVSGGSIRGWKGVCIKHQS